MATSTSKPKRSFADLFARYKTYDPEVEGYGNEQQWSQQFHERMGFEEAEAIIKANVDGKTPYEILGVTTTATVDDIKKAYRKQALLVHPDYANANGMTKEQAESAFKKLQAAYTIALTTAEKNAKARPAPKPKSSAKTESVWTPQLLNVIDEAEAFRLARSHEWMMQQKYDGVRHTVVSDGHFIGATNKLGKVTEACLAVTETFRKKQGSFRVDGELVGDIFYAFDLLEADGQDLSHQPYKVRYAFMEKWLPQSANVVLVKGYVAENDVIARLKRAGAEGVVFKRLDAPYRAGRPVSGGDQLKFKFVKTASFIVGEQNGDKHSVALFLLDENGKEVHVGFCTIGGNKPVPTPGSIIEVRYLYAYRGGCVYQPAFLGERDDVLREECTMDQLKYKGEGDEE